MDLDLERGAHVCHLFADFEEQKAIALPFLVTGLKKGEACFYVSGRQPVDDWLIELQASGVDVLREIRRGALEVIAGDEYRTPEFKSVLQARQLQRFIDGRLAHFPHVRIAGDVGWELEPPVATDSLCHWEATANLVFEDQDVSVICQYDVNVDSEPTLLAALRTHPQVIVRKRLYANPAYEAPLILANEPHLNHSDADRARVDGILQQVMSSPGRKLR